jgi:hypothetical protein
MFPAVRRFDGFRFRLRPLRFGGQVALFILRAESLRGAQRNLNISMQVDALGMTFRSWVWYRLP